MCRYSWYSIFVWHFSQTSCTPWPMDCVPDVNIHCQHSPSYMPPCCTHSGLSIAGHKFQLLWERATSLPGYPPASVLHSLADGLFLMSIIIVSIPLHICHPVFLIQDCPLLFTNFQLLGGRAASPPGYPPASVLRLLDSSHCMQHWREGQRAVH